MQPLPFRAQSNISGIAIVLILIVLPIVFHLVATFLHAISGLFVFVLWIFIFHQTWAPPPLATEDGEEAAPAHEDTQEYRLNNIKQFYCANICSIFFKGPLDRYYESVFLSGRI